MQCRMASLLLRGIVSRNQTLFGKASRTVAQSGFVTKQNVAGNQNVWSSTRQLAFGTSRRQFCDKTNKVTPVAGQAPTDDPIIKVASSAQHEHFSARTASDFDKRLLVFFGKYKSREEVPSTVSVHLVNSVRNKFRIYVNLLICLVTVVGCGTMIYVGHSKAGKGDTLADQNMKRHPQHYQRQPTE